MTCRFTTFALFAAALVAAPAVAADIAWDGNGDADASGDWGTTVGNELNWAGNANPGTGEVAQLLDVSTGTRTVTLQNATTVQGLTIAQTTPGAVNTLTLNANLTLTNATPLTLTRAAGEPQSLVVNLAGRTITMNYNSNPSDTRTHTLRGTWNFNAAGSTLITTNTGNETTFNFSIEDTLNVSANATIGRSNESTSGGVNLGRSETFTFGSASDVDVTGGTLTLIKRIRSGKNNANLIVENSGALDVASGAGVLLRHDNHFADSPTQATSFTNTATGTVTLGGNLAFSRSGSGTVSQTITNLNVFVVNGNDAAITRSGANTIAFTNAATGTLRGDSASDTLDYDGLNAGVRMTISSSGAVAPGAGHAGSGLASVGDLNLQDINLTFTGAASTLRLDLGGTSAGQFDTLTLLAGDSVTAGDLTIDSTNTQLELAYVNGFNPTAGFEITILNYGSVSGAFDLANNLTITGATGLAADTANYNITYLADHAVLTLIPEPGVLALLGLSGALLLPARRADRKATEAAAGRSQQ